MSFISLRYSVAVGKHDRKEILCGISAYFTPGSLNAIMGSSGCGKSTLLDILAGQKNTGWVSGDIRINGLPYNQQFRRSIAYVMQFDVLYPTLTPRETLQFITELRMGKSFSKQEKLTRVQSTLEDLDLVHVADTRIGSSTDATGLSGV